MPQPTIESVIEDKIKVLENLLNLIKEQEKLIDLLKARIEISDTINSKE